MKLSDCYYDKIKLLYQFSRLLHFIERHGNNDAQRESDPHFETLLNYIKQDLQKYIGELEKIICKR
jgi:hypothetical protein